jgi:hypothetical protein
MLMGIVFEKFDESTRNDHLQNLHQFWSDIYSDIGLQNIAGEEIVRFAATLKHPKPQGRPLPGEDSLEFFREYCSENAVRVLEITALLHKVTQKLSYLHGSPRLKAVTKISQARLLAVSLLLNES